MGRRRRRKQRVQGVPPTAEVVLWQGQRAERTINMKCMFLTLEVSQPEMFPLNDATHGALCMSSDKSVTADTSQDPIVPCVSSAAAASAQNSSSASARSSLLANTVADAAWAIASKPSRRQRPRGKAAWPVEWDAAPGLVERADRACDGSRGLRVPVASVCPAAAVSIGLGMRRLLFLR